MPFPKEFVGGEDFGPLGWNTRQLEYIDKTTYHTLPLEKLSKLERVFRAL